MSELTQQEIVRAATNSPELAVDSFELGGREFKILDLPYDDYLKFFALLEPLLSGVAGQLTAFRIGNVDGLSVKDVIKYCGQQLPEMVRLICVQTEPHVTTKDVKDWARSPFSLASIVLKQVAHNKMIEDVTDFFASLLPLMKALPMSTPEEK